MLLFKPSDLKGDIKMRDSQLVTEQMKKWAGKFGKEYTDRNAMTSNEMEELYKKQFGMTRTEMNLEFIGDMKRSIRILEAGSNIGNQLLCLQKMGFESLYGIELQEYAIELAKSRTSRINIIKGSAFDIPFKDGFFDLVFSTRVLIHVAPADIDKALCEIYRCTGKYIWGLEYFADSYAQVNYRDNADLLWKADFAKMYLDKFSDLHLIKEKKTRYLNDNNVDSMFLLEKR